MISSLGYGERCVIGGCNFMSFLVIGLFSLWVIFFIAKICVGFRSFRFSLFCFFVLSSFVVVCW